MIDSNQLESLYDEFSKGLYGYFLSFTRSDADAADLLHDVFVKLARNPKCLDGIRRVRAFLFRMAHNLAVDWARRGQSQRNRAKGMAEVTELLEPAPDPDAECFRRQLEEALGQLPEDQRSAVYLKLWGELTAEEIAEVCGVSANTVSSRYRYGLEKLRRILRPVYDEITN